MKTPLIELHGANVSLDSHRILENVNWRLERGRHSAIIGDNGSGKSTFLRLIGGHLWPESAKSRIYCFGESPTFTPLLAREKIALLSPEIQENYVRRSQDGPDNEKGWQLDVETTIITGFFDSWLLNQIPTQSQRERVEQLLKRFALDDLRLRPLLSLSQGQLRRVLLARVIVKSPEVLLLDEACSGLDYKARHHWLETLEDLAESGSITLIQTTHRREELIPAIKDRFVLKNRGLHRLITPETVPVVEAIPPLENLSVKPRLSIQSAATPLIDIENAIVSIDGTPIIEQFSWQWHQGQHFRVTGENGSGKSTFFRLLRGQLRPAWGGKIIRFGQEKEGALQEIGRQVALLSPQLQARFADQMSVIDAISTGFFDSFAMLRPLFPIESKRVDEIVSELEIEHLRGRTFGKLSYGQTRRVLLARALVSQPKIVLLDEAIDGLDNTTREWMFHFLENLTSQGVHFMMASHHHEDFPPFLNAELHFEHGKISGDGTNGSTR
jgi:molybdate transport system ATP-binding protein